jgi:hypothetical protein
MELSRYLPNGNLIFNVRGNAYIKILNDFDKKLCSDKYLQVTNNTIKFIAQNPKLLNIDKYDDFEQKNSIYPDIEYQNGVPIITHYWTDTEYIPTYKGYHDLTIISSATLKYFNITQPIINKYELKANERILDEEFRYVMNKPVKFKKTKCKINIPNIVCVYGNSRRINDIPIIKTLVSTDTNESDDEE